MLISTTEGIPHQKKTVHRTIISTSEGYPTEGLVYRTLISTSGDIVKNLISATGKWRHT